VDVKTGQHLPIAFAVHGYECYEYLPDVKKLFTLETGGGYWRKHLGSRRSKWASGVSRDAARARKKCPFLYDVATGRWERRKVGGGPGPRFCRSLIHLPGLKKVAYYGRKADFWLYDYAANTWSQVTGKGPAPSGRDYEGASCYDSKRQRIYAFNRNKKDPGRFGIYDVVTNTWIASKSKVQPDVVAGSGYSSTRTAAHYDSVNDVVFLRLRGRNAKNPGVFIYDPEKDEWTPEPISPTSGGANSFYDPELNVHVFFDARDSRLTPGEINVYRYKRR
ncbi:MAG: Kelch repeat-containing protein, partial [Planctomycetota bacterium]